MKNVIILMNFLIFRDLVFSGLSQNLINFTIFRPLGFYTRRGCDRANRVIIIIKCWYPEIQLIVNVSFSSAINIFNIRTSFNHASIIT